jgi:hypothetical protein
VLPAKNKSILTDFVSLKDTKYKINKYKPPGKDWLIYFPHLLLKISKMQKENFVRNEFPLELCGFYNLSIVTCYKNNKYCGPDMENDCF